MKSVFKDSIEQAKFTKNIRHALYDEDFYELLDMECKRQRSSSFQLHDNMLQTVREKIITSTSKEVKLQDNFCIFYNRDRRLLCANPQLIYIDGIEYIIKFDYYQSKIILKRVIQPTETITKREVLETDYAIIKDSYGREALVKFIDGDRQVFGTTKYIKKDTVNGEDEDSIRLLYKLNPDGLKKNNNKKMDKYTLLKLVEGMGEDGL